MDCSLVAIILGVLYIAKTLTQIEIIRRVRLQAKFFKTCVANCFYILDTEQWLFNPRIIAINFNRLYQNFWSSSIVFFVPKWIDYRK
jgi:hypothetical protein